MTRCEYFKPGTIPEAVALMERFNGDAAYIAGGTDVMVLMRQKKLSPKALISLRNIEELRSLDNVTLGAGITHREIEKHAFAQRAWSALHDAVCNLGSTQIRNVATIGGNICNAAPSADTACPLLVLDAEAVLAGAKGERVVPLAAFFTAPGKTVAGKGEILKYFRVPAFGETTGSAYIKHTRRQAMDLPIIGIAVRITLDRRDAGAAGAFNNDAPISQVLTGLGTAGVRCDDIRIAMGVVAPTPIRAKKAEEALKGKTLSDAVVAEASEIAATEASPRDSVRGEAWYRTEMVKVLTRRAVMRAIERVIKPGQPVYPDRAW